MPAPDLEMLEQAITTRLLSLMNTELDPEEPLLRSVFNMEDETMAVEETGVMRAIKLPAVGLLHEEEAWSEDELIGTDVSKEGEQLWTLVLLTDAPKAGGGMRGPRGVYRLSGAIFDAFDGWFILPGCPVAVRSRKRFRPRNEGGELLPFAGQSIVISHPVHFESE